MTCPKCGSQNEDTARFCRTCGSNLNINTATMQINTNESVFFPLLIIFLPLQSIFWWIFYSAAASLDYNLLRYGPIVFSGIFNTFPLLASFFVKQKGWKIACIIFSIIGWGIIIAQHIIYLVS